jgi:hypothetical protein
LFGIWIYLYLIPKHRAIAAARLTIEIKRFGRPFAVDEVASSVRFWDR